MLIAVLHNQIAQDAQPDEQDNLVQMEEVSRSLAALGHRVSLVPCPLNLSEPAEILKTISPDVVFNLVESIEGAGRLIHFAPSLLESLGLRYTGCPPDACYVTSNKLLAKEAMARNGIPTAPWVTSRHLRGGRPVPRGKVIIKSVWEHASIGLSESSIIEPTGADELIDELEDRMTALGGADFAEDFVDGREFNLALLETDKGPILLPPAEMCFDSYPESKPRIVGYEAKWSPESFEYSHTIRRFDFPAEDSSLVRRLGDLALECWETFGLRGYARVDFRVDEGGSPYVLEVNTNPCISSDAGFIAAAFKGELTQQQVVDAILNAAPQRRNTPLVRKIARNEAVAGYRDRLVEEDRPLLESMLRGTGFFTDDEVPVALELVDDGLQKGEKSDYRFLVRELEGEIAAYSCYGRIPCTESSWDLYWIVVRRDLQRRKLGGELLKETEKRIAEIGGKRVYVETSGRPLYSPTRLFYQRNGYVEEALLKDFYSNGDGKHVFVRKL